MELSPFQTQPTIGSARNREKYFPVILDSRIRRRAWNEPAELAAGSSISGRFARRQAAFTSPRKTSTATLSSPAILASCDAED